MEVFYALGGIAGIIALLGFLWTIFFQMAKIKVRTDTLWEVYVIEALKSQHVQHSSLFGLNPASLDLIPDEIKPVLKKIAKHGTKKSLGQIGAEAVIKVGTARIAQLAREKGCSVQDMIAVFTAYADSQRPQGKIPDLTCDQVRGHIRQCKGCQEACIVLAHILQSGEGQDEEA